MYNVMLAGSHSQTGNRAQQREELEVKNMGKGVNQASVELTTLHCCTNLPWENEKR